MNLTAGGSIPFIISFIYILVQGALDDGTKSVISTK